MTSNFTVLDFSVEITLDPVPKWQQIQEDKEIMTKRSIGTATNEDHVVEKEKEGYDNHQHETSSSSSMTMNQHEKDTQSSSPCVVGTITLLPNAIMVWIGWGRQDHHEPPQPQRQRQEEEESDGALKTSKNIGTGMPVMGPLVVAMPQRHYKGAFGTSSRAMRSEFSSSSPCSQLIGGDQELEVMLGNSMAMRLAQKVGKPVYVSCSLSSHAVVGNTAPSSTTCTATTSGDNGMTINSIMTQHGSLDVDMEKSALVTHAAALAEQKIARLVLERLQK